MTTRAARRAVARVGVNQAIGLAADGESARVVRTLEGSRAVRAEVDATVSNVEASTRSDRDGQVVTVDEGHIIVVESIGCGEREPVWTVVK